MKTILEPSSVVLFVKKRKNTWQQIWYVPCIAFDVHIICILFSLPTYRYFLAANLDLDFGSFGSGFRSRKAANSGVHQREDL